MDVKKDSWRDSCKMLQRSGAYLVGLTGLLKRAVCGRWASYFKGTKSNHFRDPTCNVLTHQEKVGVVSDTGKQNQEPALQGLCWEFHFCANHFVQHL